MKALTLEIMDAVLSEGHTITFRRRADSDTLSVLCSVGEAQNQFSQEYLLDRKLIEAWRDPNPQMAIVICGLGDRLADAHRAKSSEKVDAEK